MTEQLEQTLATMKQEIDSLQVQSRHFIRPWYKEGAALVSMLALIFSFGTTAVSYLQATDSKIQASRAQLRELILRLGKSPREMLELQQRYRNDAQVLSGFSSLINTENIILAKQASEIIWSIPEQVSSVEHIAIGSTLMQSNLPQLARRHFLVAAEKAADYNEVVGAYRSIGAVDYQLGNVAGGRENYALAKSVLRSGRIEPLGAAFMDWSDAITEIRWAQAESATSSCEQFDAHLGSAGQHAGRLPPAWSSPVVTEIEQVRQQGCPPGAYVPPAPADGALPPPEAATGIDASMQ